MWDKACEAGSYFLELNKMWENTLIVYTTAEITHIYTVHMQDAYTGYVSQPALLLFENVSLWNNMSRMSQIHSWGMCTL